jgi:Tyrosine-protein kinase ephrin type A/B receptor-like
MLHLITLSILIIIVTDAMATCLHTFQNCGPGCYNKDNLVLNGGLRICSPVGAGYFSPNNDNIRYACPRGSYADQDEAEACSICDAGSISGVAFRSCFLCPEGFYQELPGQFNCKECLPGYTGEGSNDFSYDVETNTLRCELTGVAPSSVPSASPTNVPTLTPSTTPSIMPSHLPSMRPSTHPSLKPIPSTRPSLRSSSSPSLTPTVMPSASPSAAPSVTPRRAAVLPAYVLIATLSFLGLVFAAIAWKVCRRRTSLQEDVETTSFEPEDQKPVDAVRHYPSGYETKATACKGDTNNVLDVIVILDATVVDNDKDKHQAVTAVNDTDAIV